MSESNVEAPQSVPTWSTLRVAVYAAIAVVISFIAYIPVLFVVLVMELKAGNPDLDVDTWMVTIASDGDVVAWSLFVANFVGLSTVVLMSRHRAPGLRALLGIAPARPMFVLTWLAVALAIAFGTDLLKVALGRPPMPEYWLDTYASADWPVLLLLPLAIAAPAFEETLFRGFLLEGLRVSGVRTWTAIGVSAVAWTGIHFGSDPFEMAVTLALGLLLGFVRVRSGSLVPGLVIHSIWNASAWAQMTYLVGAS